MNTFAVVVLDGGNNPMGEADINDQDLPAQRTIMLTSPSPAVASPTRTSAAGVALFDAVVFTAPAAVERIALMASS